MDSQGKDWADDRGIENSVVHGALLPDQGGWVVNANSASWRRSGGHAWLVALGVLPARTALHGGRDYIRINVLGKRLF
jgi:hypothetical protein